MFEILQHLARVFHDAGKELYIVGGTVRDLLLHRDVSPDVDLTTNARPEEIKRLVAQTQPQAVYAIGEKFGTIGVHYAPPTTEGQPQAPETLVVEITTYRSERYDPTSRKPEVTFGDVLQDDLMRRDFTINALARDPQSGELLDYTGGRADIEQRLIRAVGDDPERRFDEDPLRMLRAARFAAQLEFRIEERTLAAMARQAESLRKISAERIRDEFTKLLISPHPALGIRLLVETGLMAYVVPEVLELRGVSQRPAHSKDVYEHVLRVVERIPPRVSTRWAALLHDIAKPRTRSVENGKVHFFGHEDVGAAMARDILRRLRFDRPQIEHVTRLVRMHMRANAYLPDWTDGAVRRLMLEADDTLQDLLDLSRADITSYRPEKVSRAVARVAELEARAAWLRAEAERVPLKSPLDGHDLMVLFGREAGPWLRPLKEHLLGLVLDGELAPDDRAGATEAARRFDAAQQAAQSAPTAPTPATPAAPVADPAASAGERPRVAKREARATQRRQSRATLPQTRPLASSPLESRVAPRRASQSAHPAPARTVARDEIVRFLDEYLQVARFRDVGPNGMQVLGKPTVRRVALGVSAHLDLFTQAAARAADMVIVHHGLLVDRDPRPILARMKARLQLLFAHDITLLGYHLPLDAHPEVGNNVQWLKRLGFTVESLEFAPFLGQPIGAIGRWPGEPLPRAALVERVAAVAGSAPRLYAFGPEQITRLGVVTGGAPSSLEEAVASGCDAFLTGETAEGTLALAREEHANFLAVGHYNSERLGVQALGALLAERFGIETFFLESANDA